MRRFLLRLRNLFASADTDREFERELRAHQVLLQDAYERSGLSAEDAARAARMAIGGVEQAKELHRDARSFVWVNELRQDAVHGLRLLRRSRLFTVTAVLSLGIGIGANAAIFTIANALLWRPPEGVSEPRALVDIGVLRGDGGLNPMSSAAYRAIVDRSTTLSAVFAQHLFPQVMSLATTATPLAELASGQLVTVNYFRVLGVRAALGRLYVDGDSEMQSPTPIVFSHAFWGARFNRDSGVVGRLVLVNGRPHVVVGVAEQSFRGSGVARTDFWLPLNLDGRQTSVVANGRLRPGVSVVQAAAELAAIGAALEREQGKPRLGPPLHAIPSSRAGGNRTLVLGLAGLLLAIGLTVLAVACANVAAILLTRATARCTELALRIALGASRARLVRQLLTETIILAGLGGVVGLVLARAMISFTPLLPALPFPIDVPLQLDWRVVTFTTLLTFTAALSAGVAPAFTGSKANPAAALKDRQASDSGSRLRRLFVGGQVALSVLLIVTAGLFVRALRYAGAAEPGFDARGVEIAALDLSMAGVNEGARSSFWRTLRQSVRRLPDVESASLARVPPGGFEGIGLGTLSMPGAITPERFSPAWNIVDPGYFATLRIPLIAGRDFSDGDVQGSPPVAIVGEALARRLWPTATGIGEHLAVSIFTRGKLEERSLLVVGVVRDIKSSSLIDGLAESYVYLPLQQSDETTLTTRMSIVARSRRGQRIDAELAAAVRQLNSGLLVARSETMEQAIALGLAPQRLLATAAGSLGLIGLLLAAIGINGVTAFAVVRRRHEIGIRLALGAQRRAIVGEIVRQGMKLIVVGAVAGLLLAAGASQALSIFLYGLPPIHVPTFVGTAILFVLVGLTACWVPARRAVSADPYQTLREE